MQGNDAFHVALAKGSAACLLYLLLTGCGETSKQSPAVSECGDGPRSYAIHDGPFWHLRPIASDVKIQSKVAAVAKLDRCFSGTPKARSLKISGVGTDRDGLVYLALDDTTTTDVQYVYVIDARDRVIGAYKVGTYSGPALSIEPIPKAR